VFRLVALLFLCSAESLCVPEGLGGGTRAIGLAGAFVAIGGSEWCTTSNPAGLSSLDGWQAAAFLCPGQFGMKELRTTSIAMAIPFGTSGFGVVGRQFGFDLYRETSVSVGVGKTFVGGVSVGGTLNATRIAIERYGSVVTSSANCGALIDVADGVHLGFEWENVAAARIGSTGEALPQTQSFGFCFELSRTSRLCLESEKDIRFPFELKLGYEQEFLDVVTARFGLANNPQKMAVGIDVRVSQITFSYAGYTHPQLGWSHQIELSCTLSR